MLSLSKCHTNPTFCNTFGSNFDHRGAILSTIRAPPSCELENAEPPSACRRRPDRSPHADIRTPPSACRTPPSACRRPHAAVRMEPACRHPHCRMWGRIRESRLRIADDPHLAWGVIRGLVVPQWLRYHPDGLTKPVNLSTFPPHSSEYPNYAPLQTGIMWAAVVIRSIYETNNLTQNKAHYLFSNAASSSTSG
jgi:hypothetical protein